MFDWHNAIGAGYQDRADHVIRFDSSDYSGFKYSLSASKMNSSTDNAVVSFALAYNAERFGIHGGAYLRFKKKKLRLRLKKLTMNSTPKQVLLS